MAYTPFDQFLSEATYRDHASDSTIDGDAFYGLYTSWCYVSQNTPQPQHVFWEAMGQRISPGHRLRMRGPAATDYLLNSY
ncbi:hypothetical protein [Arthrobacter sp. ZGTC412]|uniref:hypothetical protein n=1 Tax=Arthrobacter sp. ZGTC412 TaxID=2058900 RepID=UPI000CE538BC|nr:hypothetical protein [Arthrobacter sp. ZGTC412]